MRSYLVITRLPENDGSIMKTVGCGPMAAWAGGALAGGRLHADRSAAGAGRAGGRRQVGGRHRDVPGGGWVTRRRSTASSWPVGPPRLRPSAQEFSPFPALPAARSERSVDRLCPPLSSKSVRHPGRPGRRGCEHPQWAL